MPTSSHMYRQLIPALADRYHVIAPDHDKFLSSRGVINGYPNSTFLPASNATRAEIVVMLMRLIDRQQKDALVKDE